jgi:molybdopterin-guanine dinucleotide biosynthesis protein A
MYDGRVLEMTAFVLAGGKSTRMGEDKAFLELGGKTLLERALRSLRQLAPDVMIVGEQSKFAQFGSVVEDVFRDRGPLGGIHAALTASATDLNLMMAVDMPFMEFGFLQYLLQHAERKNAEVVVPRVLGRLQPLCAVYRKSFQAAAERSLLRGDNKIDALFQDVRTTIIDEDEIVASGFSPAIFDNLNTRTEFEQAKKRHT